MEILKTKDKAQDLQPLLRDVAHNNALKNYLTAIKAFIQFICVCVKTRTDHTSHIMESNSNLCNNVGTFMEAIFFKFLVYSQCFII